MPNFLRRDYVAGWLDPNGVCHYVPDYHTDWAARHLNIPWSSKTSTDKELKDGLKIDKILYDQGWVRIIIKPGGNYIYFDTLNKSWKNLTYKQRLWLYDTSINGYEIKGDEIFPGNDVRTPIFNLKFGDSGANINTDELIESKLSFSDIMKKVLTERMSFRQLFNGSESGRVQRGRTDVNVRPLRVTTMDGNEAWTFRYKSDPSTTGNPWHGYVQFFKEDASGKDSAEDLDCMVDCDCPDYRYRYAYNNAQADVGRIGRHPDWKYGNDNNGRKWRPRSQGGVGDFGVGLCKHLCALSEYLRTKIEPNAPEPEENPEPTIKPKPISQPITPETPTTTDAPEPGDTYSDSRAGSLQEGRGRMYEIIDRFAKSNPQFEVMYGDSNNELNEDYNYHHKEYRLYEGFNDITVIFEDNSRLSFEVHYHNNHGEDKEKWRHKAFTTWKSLANEIHGDVQLSEVGNPIQKTWKQSFKEAMKHPKLQEYMRHPYQHKIFPDKGYPPEVQGKPAPCIDPVNFTSR